MTPKRYHLIIVVLGGLTALAPFSIDTYLPAFPDIASSFVISTRQVTLSLSSFLLGTALGQILYGPLLDRFGRKRPLYVGLSVYLLATIGCYLAQSIDVLVAFRFVQAIGSCAAGVVAMVLVRDLFPLAQNASIFSRLMLALGTSPLIAPSVGSLLTAAFGWRSIFGVLFALAFILLLAVYTVLPESGKPDKTPLLSTRTILIGYWQVLTVPQFVRYTLVGSVAQAGLLAYIASSPALFMEGYGLPTRTYGWLFALITMSFIGLTQLNRLFAPHFSPQRIVWGALISMTLLSLLLLSGLQLEWLGVAGVATLLFLVLGCIGIVNSNATALALAPFERQTGLAASLYGSFQWGMAGGMAALLSHFKTTTAIPLATLLSVTSLSALLIVGMGYQAGHRPTQFNAFH